jgi:hypothetical protein
MDYHKFFYWISSEDLSIAIDDIQNQLQVEKIPQAEIRQCESLFQSRPIMHVPPLVWSANCKRQGSWFRQSIMARNHLFVSNSPLTLKKVIISGEIEKISLEKVPSVSTDQYLVLLETEPFRSLAPEEWFHLLDFEKPLYRGFLDRNRVAISLDEFTQMHSANHANFLLPKESVRVMCEYNNEKIPCSLFPQLYICSACMEIFGVIGAHHGKMIVKKCPGLKYISLAEDEFLFIHLDQKSA